MISDALKSDVQQVRLNELAGKYIHESRLRWPQRGTLVVDIVTFVVPILYFAPRIIWSGAEHAGWIGAVDVVLSVTLLSLAIVKQLLRWDTRVQSHRNCISQNTRTANQALELIQDENASDEAAKWFLRRAKDPNAEEKHLLENVAIKLKQNGCRSLPERSALLISTGS